MRDRVAQKATRQMGRMVVEDPSTLLAQAPGAPPDTSDLEAVSRSSTLLLLHPLCLRAGRVGVALDWLARNELLVFDAEPLRMREEQIRLVWHRQIRRHGPMRRRVVTELLTFGPALLLGVAGRPTRDTSVASRIQDLKGPADPHALAPHHLRAWLGATNLFNNLVHAPDDPAEAARQSAVLLPGRRCAELWDRAGAAVRDGRGMGRDDVLRLAPPADLQQPVSLPHVAVRWRVRLMAEIRGTLGPEGRRRLAAAERPLDEEVRWLARPDAPPPGTILAEFRRRFRPLLPPLRRAVDGPGVDTARRRVALTVLFGQMEGVLFRSAGDPDRITAAAADAGLAMDAADAVVLATECLSALVAAGESPA